jgi:glutathione S-transferase
MAARQLYFSPNSPFARKVRIVLAEKGLAYEGKSMDTSHPPEGFAKLNPNLRVPVLVDGGRTLFESNVILDYLLRTYPAAAAGAPKPALAASVARADRHWDDMAALVTIETLLDTGINLYQFIREGMKVEQAPYLKKELSRTQSCLDWLEARLSPEGYMPGQFSIQDLNLVCALTWADFRQPFAWRGRKNLERIVASYVERPSVKETRPGQ